MIVQAWCKKCGSPLVVVPHTRERVDGNLNITVKPCSVCVRAYVQEAVKAGRSAVMQELSVQHGGQDDD